MGSSNQFFSFISTQTQQDLPRKFAALLWSKFTWQAYMWLPTYAQDPNEILKLLLNLIPDKVAGRNEIKSTVL